MANELSEIFDVEPPPKQYQPPALVIENSQAEADIDLARAHLKQLLKTVDDAITEAMEIAISSESPRGFEVVTGMISAAGDLTSKLIASHQVQQKMRQENGEKTPTNVTNNSVVFTGTPAELAKLLKGKQ